MQAKKTNLYQKVSLDLFRDICLPNKIWRKTATEKYLKKTLDQKYEEISPPKSLKHSKKQLAKFRTDAISWKHVFRCHQYRFASFVQKMVVEISPEIVFGRDFFWIFLSRTPLQILFGRVFVWNLVASDLFQICLGTMLVLNIFWYWFCYDTNIHCFHRKPAKTMVHSLHVSVNEIRCATQKI